MKNGITIMTSLMKHQWKKTRKLVRVQGKNVLLLFVAFTMAVPPQLVNQAFGAAVAATTQSGTGAASQLIKGAVGTGQGSPNPADDPAPCSASGGTSGSGGNGAFQAGGQNRRFAAKTTSIPGGAIPGGTGGPGGLGGGGVCSPCGSSGSDKSGNNECVFGICTLVGGNPVTTSSSMPVYLRYGSAYENITDLIISSPALNWTMSRSYTSNGTGATSLGNRWMGGIADTYLLKDGNNIDMLVNAASKRTFTSSNGSPPFTAPEDSSFVLDHDTANDEYRVTDTQGTIRYTFHDFTVTNSAHRGLLKEQSNIQWNTQSNSGTTYSYQTDGKLNQITTADGQDYSIVFTYSGSNISKVEVKNTGGTVIQKAEYTYYDDVTSPSTEIGSTGDLVQVKVSSQATADTGSTMSIVKYTQYRYDTDSKLKAVYENDSIQRIIANISGISTADNILTKADDYGTPKVKEFSSRSFEYYSTATSTSSITTPFITNENLNTTYGGSEVTETNMVKSETIGGCNSCGSATAVKKSYYYIALAQGDVDQNEVVRIVIEDTEDADGTAVLRVVYGLDESGRTLRKVKIDNPSSSPKYWCESYTMATTGKSPRIAEKRFPSAHSVTSAANLRDFLDPYDSTGDSWTKDTNTLNTSDGLIHVYGYNSDGMQTDTKMKKGKSGTEYYFSAGDYGDGDGDAEGDDYDNNTMMIASYYYPDKTSTRNDGIKTTYSYTFWDSDDHQVKTKTTTLAIVPTSQNGSGVATTMVEYYDNLGRLRWTKDGEGYIKYLAYHPVFGSVAFNASDVDPASPGTDVTSGSSGEWESWTVGSANSNKPTRDSGLPVVLNLSNKTYLDEHGRTYAKEDSGGAKHYTVYEDDRIIKFPYWDSTNSKSLLPIQVTQLNDEGKPESVYAVKASYTSISTSSSEPTGFSTEPSQSDYVSLTKITYDDTYGRLKYVDQYHDIPSSGNGTLDTNFYRTVTQYDAMGRAEYQIQVVSGSSASDRKEQITQNIYDFLGRVTEIKSGVSGNSAANSHNMTDDYNSYPTLNTIRKMEYDDNGVGDGYLTKAKNYFGTGANDYTGTNPKRTYRGHVRAVELFYMNGSTETAYTGNSVSDINWQGVVTATAYYDTTPTWSTVLTGDGYTNYASSTTSNRRTLDELSFDDQGMTYQSKKYKISKSTGTGSNHFLTNYYYNRNRQLIATQTDGSTGKEYAIDALGRSYQTRTVIELESTKYSSGAFQYRSPTPEPSLSSMSGGDDKVLSISHSVYDNHLKIESHFFEVNHDDSVAGLDLTNNDDYIRSSVYQWYDEADRVISSANYGSGDTTAGVGIWKYTAIPNRPTTAPTVSSEVKLITQRSYNSDTGVLEIVTDPTGVETRTFQDDLGRVTYTAENYDDFNASTEANTGDSTDKSKDRVTKFVYNGAGQITESAAMDANADGNLSDNQSTVYLFEDSTSSSLITSEIYPDSSDTSSSGTDQIKKEYNLDGSLKKQTDQIGTVIEYTYNIERQLELTKVTTLGTGVDGHVRSIKRSYNNLTQLEKVTSYPNSDGTGAIRNEIQVTFDDLGNITNSYQSHESAVNTLTTPDVEYSYDTTVVSSVFTNQHRQEKVTYPNGRIIYQNYEAGTTDSLYDSLNYIKKIQETDSSGTELAVYDMTPFGQLTLFDLPEPNIKLDRFQGTSGTYAGYDRFGRVKDQYWEGYSSTANVDRIKYGHDYAGSRTYRDIDSSIYAGNDKDQVYSYDDLHRLTNSDEGSLSGSTISGTPTKQEEWTLDGLGNWSGYVTKTSGTEVLNQARTPNDVNEITNVTESTGPAWATPAYDAVGNMTTVPKPSDLTAGYTATYDAWNRLVKLTDGATTIAEYEYDGNNRRIVKTIYSAGSLDHKKHFYYNNKWQVLEVRKEASGTEDSDPLEQYVYHPYYVDAVLLRDYDADTDGTSVRYYYIHDANYNITAVTDSSGTVLERYHYTAYGDLNILDADFSDDADGISDISNSATYSGRRYDSETGIYYYRNRYYHAELGQFISRDPIKYDGGDLNLYRYVGNSPLSMIDPNGLQKVKGFPMNSLEEQLGLLDPKCKGQAKDIAAAINATWKRNKTWRFFGALGNDQRSHGHYCYNWARAFEESVNDSMPKKNSCFTVKYEGATHPTEDKGHFWIKICSKSTKKCIYVDDAFGPSGMPVSPNRPQPTKYTDYLPNAGLVKYNRCDNPVKACNKDGEFIPRPTPPPYRPKTAFLCFPAGTHVWGKNGLVSIESVRAGEFVKGFNVNTGEIILTKVHELLIHNEGNIKLNSLILENKEEIFVTDGHPIFTGNQWIESHKIMDMDLLTCLKKEKIRTNKKMHLEKTVDSVYNLVTENGTFIVGKIGIIVSGKVAP